MSYEYAKIAVESRAQANRLCWKLAASLGAGFLAVFTGNFCTQRLELVNNATQELANLVNAMNLIDTVNAENVSA